jgi:diguanylate cyclase (GGDEF)-like protein/excisionase family DNA binding protein
MPVRLADLPLDVREQTAEAIRQRKAGLVSDLSAAVPDGVTVDADTWTACIDALVALLTTIVDAGKIEDRRGTVHLLSDASPWLTIGRLLHLMQHVERAVLDELALHDRLGATSERWPIVAQSVRSAMLEVIGAFAEGERVRTGLRDPLTTLFSRDLFDVALQQETERAERHGHGIAVILFDIDDFSTINRVHGYGAGNRLLERLGILSRRFFRTHDWVARHGDDSIAALLPETTLDQAAVLANRFRETVQQRLVLFDHKSEASTTVTVSASAVGTDHVQSEVEPRYVMVEAEAALLRAKMNGRNRVERVALLPTSVTIVGAATLLGVSTREVIRLLRAGDLRASRRGRHFHIDRSVIEEYRARRT